MLSEAHRHHRDGRLEEAEALYGQILDANPGHADALAHLGVIAHQRGRHAEAVELMERAIRLEPRRADYYSNLGAVRMSQARPREAEACYREAVRLEPDLASAHYCLGNILWERGDRSAAAVCYRSVVRLDPSNEAANHLLAAASGARRRSVPSSYVAGLFDGFSEGFESRLVGELGYRVPQILFESVLRARPSLEARWNVLDLGCGTGLCGSLFRERACHLEGVDLSARMIEMAHRKKSYDVLRHGELLDELRTRRRRWDLVLAADVFNYVGALDDVLMAGRQALAPNGLLAFSVETHRGEDVHLGSSGRFAHSPDYVDRIAAQNRFSIVRREAIGIRFERGNEVAGLVYVLCAGEASGQTDPLESGLLHCEPTLSVLKQAIELHRDGHLDEAERLYRRVLGREPGNARALRFLEKIVAR